MRRADRLFQIIQILRRSTQPVTASRLAAELEVSQRSVYRDIADLMGQRVPIRGEPGIGYALDRDFDMPPLMLTPDELEAAVLGAQWVADRGDAVLAILGKHWATIADTPGLREEAEARVMGIIYAACRTPSEADTPEQWLTAALTWLRDLPLHGPMHRCWSPEQRRTVEQFRERFKHSTYETALADYLLRESVAPYAQWPLPCPTRKPTPRHAIGPAEPPHCEQLL